MDFKLGGAVGAWVLDKLTQKLGAAPWDPEAPDGVPRDISKVERWFGPSIWQRLRGKTVVDFGAGPGFEAVEVAVHGAAHVYGFEIRPNDLATARARAARSGVTDRCEFFSPIAEPERLEALHGRIDMVYTLDSFEHFANPDAVLRQMHRLLRPGGVVLISFGPPWKHPYGAHMGHFNRIPWIHFLFREQTVIDVRSRYHDDGATRYEETGDGLNRMTVARFVELVRASDFTMATLKLIPVKKLTPLTMLPLTREYFTSVVQAELVNHRVDGAQDAATGRAAPVGVPVSTTFPTSRP
jgi:SAM-dependent methyltransferase